MEDGHLLTILNSFVYDDFKIFKWYLKKEKVGDIPQISESHLSKAERHDVVDLLVQNYGFATAVEVTKSILKRMQRTDLVQKLSDMGLGAEGEHFLDKHRAVLIERIRSIDAILDQLSDHSMLSSGILEGIRAEYSTTNKVRMLLDFLQSKDCKDAFYRILENNEPFLIQYCHKVNH